MKKLAMFITGSLLLCSSYSFSKETTHLPANDVTQREINANKKLTHKNLTLLDLGLQQNPVTTLRIKMSAQAVKKVLSLLPKAKNQSFADQKQFVAKQLDAILKPIEQFFDIIQDYSGMILPLLEESLTNHQQTTNPLLIRYFKSKQNIKPFCEKEIISLTLLEKICQELSGFFGDLEASFSPEVEAACKDLVKTLRKK